MKIKKEILTVMHETLPCYLVLQVGAKLSKCFRGHLRTPHAISCISHVLLYDWPSHLREQINRTFQFRNCHGKFFCSFWCIHGNNPGAVSVWGKRLHTKKSFPVGKRYLPMGKRASVTTTNVSAGFHEIADNGQKSTTNPLTGVDGARFFYTE